MSITLTATEDIIVHIDLMHVLYVYSRVMGGNYNY